MSGALQPPRLSLFLDADGNFEQNGQNDAAAYVPATVFTTGASVPTMPEGTALQQIRVIAAWVNDSNQIIAPPSWSQDVAFWMEKTSAFKGYAMNAGSSEDADFLLVDSTAGFQSNLAVGHINVFDYGGRTEINAATGGQMAVIKIPLAGEDWIPEAGWKVYANGELLSEVSALGLVAGADADAAPTGNGTNGDGLRVFEEYRGFVVRDEHRRTDPATKDLFIDSTTAVNIGWAINLSVTKHFVWETQLLGDREINTNFMNAGPQGDVPNHSTQRGIVVRENNYLGEGVYGETWPVSGLTWNADCPSQDPLNPNKTLIALLYTKAIREHSPTYTNPFPNAQDVEDSADPAAQKKTVGHEIGHAVGMCHYSYVPSEGGLTVMVSGFLDFADAAWSNIPSTYDPTDNNQLRLK